MSGWYLQTGKDKARMFYTPYDDHRCWTDDRSLAQCFDTKAEATIVQAEIVAELGIPVACVSEAVTSR